MRRIENVVILNLDGVPDKTGDFFDDKSVIQCDYQNVPLTNEVGDIIGEAETIMSLKGGKQLMVHLEFFQEITPIFRHLRPSFTGKCVDRMANHILKAKLTSVMLAQFNADDRIPYLESYLKNIEPKQPASDVCKCPSLLAGHDPECGWKRKYGSNQY